MLTMLVVHYLVGCLVLCLCTLVLSTVSVVHLIVVILLANTCTKMCHSCVWMVVTPPFGAHTQIVLYRLILMQRKHK